MSTSIGFSIPPEDGLLLQYLYSGQRGHLIQSMVRQYAAEYGISIPHPALRHALLAFASGCLPPQHFRQSLEYHKSRCLQILIPKLQSPLDLSEMDLFAAFTVLETLSEDNDEIFIHAAGCIQMLHFLTKSKPVSSFLANLGPWIRSRLFYLRTAYYEVPPEIISLSELTRCFTQLRYTAYPVEAWNSGSVEALNDFMFDLTWSTAKWFEELAFNELYQTPEKKWSVQSWTEHIKARLYDENLPSALALTEEAFKKDNDDCCDAEHVTLAYQFVRFNAIKLMLGICESKSALTTIKSSKTKFVSAKLLMRVHTFGLKVTPMLDREIIFGLLGLTLSTNDILESKYVLPVQIRFEADIV